MNDALPNAGTVRRVVPLEGGDCAAAAAASISPAAMLAAAGTRVRAREVTVEIIMAPNAVVVGTIHVPRRNSSSLRA